MREKQASAHGSANVTSPSEAPELPTEKAFVVQLTRETDPSLEQFAGRVEHIASGRRLRFGEEFGSVVAFLCSTHAGFITGQNVLIDGGGYLGSL